MGADATVESKPVETCSCDAHCQQCGGCGIDLNEFGFCAACLTPRYRWIPACAACHVEVEKFTDLSDRGECTRCFVARMAKEAA